MFNKKDSFKEILKQNKIKDKFRNLLSFKYSYEENKKIKYLELLLKINRGTLSSSKKNIIKQDINLKKKKNRSNHLSQIIIQNNKLKKIKNIFEQKKKTIRKENKIFKSKNKFNFYSKKLDSIWKLEDKFNNPILKIPKNKYIFGENFCNFYSSRLNINNNKIIKSNILKINTKSINNDTINSNNSSFYDINNSINFKKETSINTNLIKNKNISYNKWILNVKNKVNSSVKKRKIIELKNNSIKDTNFNKIKIFLNRNYYWIHKITELLKCENIFFTKNINNESNKENNTIISKEPSLLFLDENTNIHIGYYLYYKNPMISNNYIEKFKDFDFNYNDYIKYFITKVDIDIKRESKIFN